MVYDRLQLQRFELKYLVPEPLALAVRKFVSSYLELDEHGVGRPQGAYPIHSLYLDSTSLRLYWDTINGNRNRFKLRLRFYGDQPESPVYFEIKRRVNAAILKQRAALRRGAVAGWLRGQFPEESDFVFPGPETRLAMERFHELVTQLQARPIAHVAYWREAWINPADNSVRVTLDREVRFEPELARLPDMEMRNPLSVFGQEVILELKFTGRFPNWFGELVRTFNLTQSSAAKYADGVTLLGEDRLTAMAGQVPVFA
jgi:hypothetical protein